MQIFSNIFTGTDNLFKLLFINGVLLILVGLFYPQQKKDELQLKIVEQNSTVNLLNREIIELFYESDRIKLKVKKLKKTNVELAKLIEDLRLKIYEQDKKVIEVKNKKNEIDVLIDQQNIYTKYCNIFMISGTLMTIIGLFFWGHLTKFMYYKEKKEYKNSRLL